jgi:hypothetical protein
MNKIKRTFLIFLLSKANLLLSCPLCLSLPKNSEKPFFVEQNSDYVDESINFLASKDQVPATKSVIEPAKTQ